MKHLSLLLICNAWIGTGTTLAALPLPEKTICQVQDRQAFQEPDRVRLGGWIGSRIDANEANRIARIDTDRLLEGYRKRPGRQTWDGEHVGKWLHAATLAWVNSGDAALRAKLDRTVEELLKCQLADGYLGTYLEKDRWTEWDVWAHKYNLIGLITYMRYTGNQEPLAGCRRMADLLDRTFGDTPGKRDLIQAGSHVGMAPTSVLEPMVLLYRFTGEPRYLEFCRYVLRSWEQPNGPKIVSTLMSVGRVDKVGNGKAYEMLSCLNGALEFYRTTGEDRQILEACLRAWQDIVDKRLYLTGAASSGEHFQDDHVLPNMANVGETCVTTTWIQFNAQLLRLTGEARFAEQLERVVLNQLFGAQKCDGSGWGYYVQMEGRKPYSSTLDGHCCLSSGPRGVALIPTFAVSTDADGVVVNLYEAGEANLRLKDGTSVKLNTDTAMPSDGRVKIAVNPSVQGRFAVKLRLPTWSVKSSVKIDGQAVDVARGRDGYAAVVRGWKEGDVIELDLSLEPRVVAGDHVNAGKAAVLYGPLVLAADEALRGGYRGISGLGLGGADVAALEIKPEPAPEALRSWPGARVFGIKAVAWKSTESVRAGGPVAAKLVPFADAGATGSNYKVWLPLRGAPAGANLLLQGWESRSREGNLNGSINDENVPLLVVTYDGRPAAEDWYAVSLGDPVLLGRVVFRHGRTFPDGGWFDASAGKPQVQVQTVKDGPWKTVGQLDDYPDTTATSDRTIQPGTKFTARMREPVRALAVRVIGKPACGSNSAQAFSSCGGLEAFAK